jgi:hypothetical protein
MSNDEMFPRARSLERDNARLRDYWNTNLPRPRHLNEVTTNHFGNGIRYAVDQGDAEQWIHCSAWMYPYALPEQPLCFLGWRLDRANYGVDLPVTIEMRCNDCSDCMAGYESAMMRSPLWPNGIAVQMCTTRLGAWDQLRFVHYRWWRAICAFICRECPLLRPALGALLCFGDEFFPPLPMPRKLLHLWPAFEQSKWLKINPVTK